MSIRTYSCCLCMCYPSEHRELEVVEPEKIVYLMGHPHVHTHTQTHTPIKLGVTMPQNACTHTTAIHTCST